MSDLEIEPANHAPLIARFAGQVIQDPSPNGSCSQSSEALDQFFEPSRLIGMPGRAG